MSLTTSLISLTASPTMAKEFDFQKRRRPWRSSYRLLVDGQASESWLLRRRRHRMIGTALFAQVGHPPRPLVAAWCKVQLVRSYGRKCVSGRRPARSQELQSIS